MLYLAPWTGYQGIDLLYVKCNFEAAASSLLLRTYGKLVEEGKFSENEKGMAIVGSNWREASFMIEKI